MAQMRLDKFLASYGGSTRSEVKKILKKGSVTVNGMTEKRPDCKVDPETDQIVMEGRALSYQPFVCLMFHKPSGCVTATEDTHQKTVMDYIDHPRKKELFPVGRLDIDTEGLLFLMNDGDLAHRLLSPKRHAEKTYYARVAGLVTQEDADAFAKGVDIGEKALTLPAQLEILHTCQPEETGKFQATDASHPTDIIAESESGTDAVQDRTDNVISEILLTICEGKFHQVKRMFEVRGKKVVYLKRVSMAGLDLDPSLAPGTWRELTEEETEKIGAIC